MAFLTVDELSGFFMDIKAFESLGGGLSLFQGGRCQVIDLDLLLLVAGGEGDGIIALTQGDHDPKGLVFHLDLILRGIIFDPLNHDLGHFGALDNAGQGQGLFRDPDTVRGRNNGDSICRPSKAGRDGKEPTHQKDKE